MVAITIIVFAAVVAGKLFYQLNENKSIRNDIKAGNVKAFYKDQDVTADYINMQINYPETIADAAFTGLVCAWLAWLIMALIG